MKTHIIFGATGGIGATLAEHLKEQKKNVFLVGRDPEKTAALATRLDSPYAVLTQISFENIEKIFADLANQGCVPSGVVNCIGSLLLKPAHSTSEAEWQSLVEAHLTSSFAIVRSACRTLTQHSEPGSIVLLSSTAANIGFTNHEAIASVKAGVQGLARSAAATYARHKIRVNTVSPGLTDTPLAKRITGNEAALAQSIAMHPLGRIGKPADIAKAIEWFLNPDNDWVTGQDLAVDGGISTLKTR